MSEAKWDAETLAEVRRVVRDGGWVSLVKYAVLLGQTHEQAALVNALEFERNAFIDSLDREMERRFGRAWNEKKEALR